MPTGDRLGTARVRPGLEASAEADDPHGVLVPAHRPVPLRHVRRRHGLGEDGERTAGRDEHRRRDREERADGLDAVVPDLRPQPARPRRRGRRGTGRPVAEHVVDQLKSGDLRFAAEDPDAPENFPRVLAIWRANLLGSSGKGNEYFLKHLLGTDNSLRAGEASEGQRPQEVEWHDGAPEGKLDLLLTLDFRQTSTTIFSRRRASRRYVVREARPQHHRHAPVHPLVQPGDRAPVADPDRLGRLADDRHQVQRAGRGSTRHPHGRRRCAVAARHPRRDGQPARCGPRLEARRVRAGARCHDAQDRRGRARLHRRGRTAAGPRTPTREAGHDHQGRDLRRQGVRRLPAAQERRDPRRTGRRATVAGARRPRLRGDPGAVRNHQRAPGHPGLQDPGEAHRHPAARPRGRARGKADHLRGHGGRSGAGHHLTGVVRVRDRRPALLAVHDQRREAQALAHADRPAALLPRPRLDDRARRGAAGLPAAAQHGRALQRARHRVDGGAGGHGPLPHPAQQVVDPLGVPGQPVHALALPRRPDDLDERQGRRQGRCRGQRLDRGGQPQRGSGGARDRLPPDARGDGLHAPRPGPADRRTDRRDLGEARRHPQLADPDPGQAQPRHRRLRPAVLRLQLPRTHGQPARRGHRDPQALAGGALLDEGHGPDGDGDEPRQVHRLPHLLGHLQAGMDQPHRHRVRLVQQRRDPARPGLPAALRGPGGVEGWLDAQQARPARPQGRWTAAQAAHDLLQPEDALDPGLLRALDLRLRHPDRRPGPGAHPGRAAQVAAHRQGHEDHLVVQLGRQPRRLPGHPGATTRC